MARTAAKDYFEGFGAFAGGHHGPARGLSDHYGVASAAVAVVGFGAERARFLACEQKERKVGAARRFQLKACLIHGVALALGVACAPSGEEDVVGRGHAAVGQDFSRLYLAHCRRDIRRNRVQMGAEEHLGIAPRYSQVEGAVPDFEGFHLPSRAAEPLGKNEGVIPLP